MVRILLMRHATSEWNVRIRKFKESKNVPITDIHWKCPHDFKCTYEKPEQVDAAITQDGINECIKQREGFEQQHSKIKYILCSPYRRTIQTMNHMMENYANKLDSKNIVMFPHIAEEIDCLGEFAFETENLMSQQKDSCNFSFYSAENYEDPRIWFLYNINESQGENDLKWKQINNWKTFQDKEKLFECFKEMNTKIETAKGCRSKMENSKVKIQEFIEKNNVQDNELLVVSHFNFLNYFISESFDQNDEPTNKRFIKNLEVIEYNM